MSSNQGIFQPTGDLFGNGLDYKEQQSATQPSNKASKQREELLSLLDETIDRLNKKAQETGEPLTVQHQLTPDQVNQILGSKVVSLSRNVKVSIEHELCRRSLLQFALETRLHERFANKLLLLANSRVQVTGEGSKRFKEVLNRLAVREMFMQ
jgi:hypothetical protein